MSVWIDYSFARPDLAAAKKAGATGVIRYLSPDNTATHGKICWPGERDAIFAAGLDLLLNFEWYEGRCNEGASAGAADGATAMAQAKALGLPRGACIYFSHDTGVNNMDQIGAYFRAVSNAMGGYYDTGVYSGYNVVKYLLDNQLAKYGWQTRAWSNGVKDPRAVLYQNGNYWFGTSADEDTAANYVDSWRQQLANVPKPPVVNPPAPKPPVSGVPQGGGVPASRVYVVHSGDSLSAIAARFGSTTAKLAAINHITNVNLIYVGESIHIDTQAPPVAVHPTGAVYTVKAGDNLTTIARQYPQAWITAQSLARINGIAGPNYVIHIGQVLRIG